MTGSRSTVNTVDGMIVKRCKVHSHCDIPSINQSPTYSYICVEY